MPVNPVPQPPQPMASEPGPPPVSGPGVQPPPPVNPVPQPVQGYGAPALTGSRPTNQMAIISLVAGVAGYVIPHPFIAGIAAIITGHMAKRQIAQTGEGGAGLATAGLILGYVHLVLSILVVLVVILIFAGVLIAARSSSGSG